MNNRMTAELQHEDRPVLKVISIGSGGRTRD